MSNVFYEQPKKKKHACQTWGQLHAKVINYNSITITFLKTQLQLLYENFEK